MMETGYAVNGRYQIIRPIEKVAWPTFIWPKIWFWSPSGGQGAATWFTNDPNTVRRFKREALATTELNHPNIVSIYDVVKKTACNTSMNMWREQI